MKKILSFLKESRTELAKVEWPTLSQAIRYTIGVILISFLVGLVVFAMDFLFSRGVRELVTRVEIWKEQRLKSAQTTPPAKVENVEIE